MQVVIFLPCMVHFLCLLFWMIVYALSIVGLPLAYIVLHTLADILLLPFVGSAASDDLGLLPFCDERRL